VRVVLEQIFFSLPGGFMLRVVVPLNIAKLDNLGSQKLREILTLLCCIILSSSRKSNAVLKR